MFGIITGVKICGIRITANISVFQTEDGGSIPPSRTIRLTSFAHGKPFISLREFHNLKKAQNNELESNESELVEDPKTNSQWFVYICKARTSRYYVDITNDPNARLKKHNTGTGAQFARDQGPFELVYVSAALSSKSEARKREIQLKGWNRSKKEKLIQGEWE
jgi:putative endonuclease